MAMSIHDSKLLTWAFPLPLQPELGPFVLFGRTTNLVTLLLTHVLGHSCTAARVTSPRSMPRSLARVSTQTRALQLWYLRSAVRQSSCTGTSFVPTQVSAEPCVRLDRSLLTGERVASLARWKFDVDSDQRSGFCPEPTIRSVSRQGKERRFVFVLTDCLDCDASTGIQFVLTGRPTFTTNADWFANVAPGT